MLPATPQDVLVSRLSNFWFGVEILFLHTGNGCGQRRSISISTILVDMKSQEHLDFVIFLFFKSCRNSCSLPDAQEMLVILALTS